MPDFGALMSSHRDYSYGEWGFRAYTNARGVLYHTTRLDLGVRYPPCDRDQALRRTLAHLGS
jgi:aldehyde dehydrogenase (NAD+)